MGASEADFKRGGEADAGDSSRAVTGASETKAGEPSPAVPGDAEGQPDGDSERAQADARTTPPIVRDIKTRARIGWSMTEAAQVVCAYCEEPYSVTGRRYEAYVRCPACRYLELAPVDWDRQKAGAHE